MRKPTQSSLGEGAVSIPSDSTDPWRGRRASPGKIAVLSAAGLCLAFPPTHWSPLIWVVPLGWLWLIRQPVRIGKRGYWKLWGATFVFWLYYLWGIRSAHPALYLGWLSLSAYLASYVPAFIAISRFLVHRRKMEFCFVAPAVWTLMEVARGYLMSGFSGGLFGHALVRWPWLIQIADLAGAYGVSWLIFSVGCQVVQSFLNGDRRRSALVAAVLLIFCLVGGTWLYGKWRADEFAVASQKVQQPGQGDSAGPRDDFLRIAILQESIDVTFDGDPDQIIRRSVEMFERYLALTRELVERDSDLDLIVWPESAFTANTPDQLVDDFATLEPPRGFENQRQEYQDFVRTRSQRFPDKLQRLIALIGERPGKRPHFLVGSDTIDYNQDPPRAYNSALFISPSGEVLGRYFKQHPVPFGEYIPLLGHFPSLARYSPIGVGISSGTEASAFWLRGFCLSPSICFESTVPHVIQGQVSTLRRQGTPPDVLVNLTNDGWFMGTGMLDMQFDSAVFRAIENRRPLLIAANTGLSGWIGADGGIVRESHRRTVESFVASIERGGLTSLYARFGDFATLGFSGFMLVLGGLARRTRIFLSAIR